MGRRTQRRRTGAKRLLQGRCERGRAPMARGARGGERQSRNRGTSKRVGPRQQYARPLTTTHGCARSLRPRSHTRTPRACQAPCLARMAGEASWPASATARRVERKPLPLCSADTCPGRTGTPIRLCSAETRQTHRGKQQSTLRTVACGFARCRRTAQDCRTKLRAIRAVDGLQASKEILAR